MHPFITIDIHFTMQSYWLMNGIGSILAVIIAILEAKRKKISLIRLLAFWILIIPIAWIGGRIGHLLLKDPRIIIQNPKEILIFWRGGLAAYGGVITAALFLVVYTKIFRINTWKLLDCFAPGVALAHTIGRIGCFLNGCCYGKSTLLPWHVTFYNMRSVAPLTVPLHPTQLYAAGGDLLMFIFLMIMRKKYKTDGILFMNYLIIYALKRSIIAPFRAESIPIIGQHIYFTYIISFFAIICSTIIIILLKKSAKRKISK